MGSRPPKATPLSMVAHSQKFGDTFALGNPPKSSTLSLVPRSPGNFDVENDFVTPRSRGRSALYSMARMPYSRVRATPSIKVCPLINTSALLYACLVAYVFISLCFFLVVHSSE